MVSPKNNDRVFSKAVGIQRVEDAGVFRLAADRHVAYAHGQRQRLINVVCRSVRVDDFLADGDERSEACEQEIKDENKQSEGDPQIKALVEKAGLKEGSNASPAEFVIEKAFVG